MPTDSTNSAPTTAWKVSKYGVFSGSYFPVLGLNTEIYGANLRIQPEYGKIRTRKNTVFEYFSGSDTHKLCKKVTEKGQVTTIRCFLNLLLKAAV